jgi:hypothetical protein
MKRHENVMIGTCIPHGDETVLKYFIRETGSTDHFVDTVREKGY